MKHWLFLILDCVCLARVWGERVFLWRVLWKPGDFKLLLAEHGLSRQKCFQQIFSRENAFSKHFIKHALCSRCSVGLNKHLQVSCGWVIWHPNMQTKAFKVSTSNQIIGEQTFVVYRCKFPFVSRCLYLVQNNFVFLIFLEYLCLFLWKTCLPFFSVNVLDYFCMSLCLYCLNIGEYAWTLLCFFVNIIKLCLSGNFWIFLSLCVHTFSAQQ